MSDCSRCGDCCDRIYLAPRFAARIADGKHRIQAGYPIGDADEGQLEDDTFLATWWTRIDDADDGGGIYNCARFDPVTRLCTAHVDRPPVCRNFPWYGEQPSLERGQHLSPRCSFNGDVRPLLPIVEVRQVA